MAFFMLFIVLGLPTSKCIDIPGKTTRSLVGTHGIILFILTSVLSFIVAPFPYSFTNTVMLCYTALVYNITFMIHLQAPLRNFPLTKRGTYKGTSK